MREGSLASEAHDAQAGLPVFQAHGDSDPLVPPALGERCRNLLRDRGHPVEWRNYPMAHEVCAEQMRDLGAWISGRLSD